MRKNTRSEIKTVLLWFALVFLTVSISLLLAETILHLLYSEEEINGNYWGIGAFEYSESTGYVHAIGYEGFAVRRGVFVSPVAINSWNLRQSNLEEQLKYPKKLLLLGDSFVFGIGVNEDKIFPTLIQKNLNVLNIGVINGAQTGYSVEQERLFGIPLIEKINPDMVIVGLYAQNDVRDDYYKRYKNIDVKFGYRLRKGRLFPVEPIDYIRTHSYLWMFVEHYLNRSEKIQKKRAFRKLAKEETRNVIQSTLDALVMLKDYCEANSMVFGVMMIPPNIGRALFDRNLKDVLTERNFNVINLGVMGFDSKDYIVGDGHWNVNGHQKAAYHLEAFAELLNN